MFGIAEGAAGIWRGWGTPDKREVAEVRAGDIFGELALVSGAPRLATVVAKGDVQVLELSRDAMHEIYARFPRVRMLVEAFSRERLLANAFRSSPIFRALTEAEQQALAAGFEARAYGSGQRIILEGLKANAVHLLLRGSCQVKHQSGQRYPDLREGDLFGEVSVLTGGSATATVSAAGPVVTLRISAADFKARVLANAEAAASVNQLAAARLERTAGLDAKDAKASGGDRRV
jgi:cAMP-dependent protein kinase regulator